MTIKELYEYGKKHIISEESASETLILLEYLCDITQKDLLLTPEKNIGEEKKTDFFRFVERRNTGEPVQYITGYTYFYGLKFECDKNVLIPRFDTENLVFEALSKVKTNGRVLDICTGSGCIAISLKHERKDLIVIASDISENALKVARRNAVTLETQVDFIQSDMFEKIEGKFDMIISNPPYIKSKVIDTLDENVKGYEPKAALDGGDDGLDYYRIIMREAAKYMNKNAYLCLEIGYDQKESVSDLLKESGFDDIKATKDLNGLYRVVTAVFGG